MITNCPIYIKELPNQEHPNCEYTILHGKKAFAVLLSRNCDEIERFCSAVLYRCGAMSHGMQDINQKPKLRSYAKIDGYVIPTSRITSSPCQVLSNPLITNLSDAGSGT